MTTNEKLAHLRSSVAAMTTASDSAEALIRGVSERIRAATENVDTSNEDSVSDSFDELEDLADQLDSEAGQLSAAVVENTPSQPGNATTAISGAPGALDPHSREGAAAAGGYDAPKGPTPAEPAEPAGSVVADTDAAAAAEGDTVDEADGDRITSQEGREAAGPFTGTGAQDALRTSDRLGDTDAHVSDTRTVEEGAEERTQEGQAADSADAPDAGDGGSTADENDTTDGDEAA